MKMSRVFGTGENQCHPPPSIAGGVVIANGEIRTGRIIKIILAIDREYYIYNMLR